MNLKYKKINFFIEIKKFIKVWIVVVLNNLKYLAYHKQIILSKLPYLWKSKKILKNISFNSVFFIDINFGIFL